MFSFNVTADQLIPIGIFTLVLLAAWVAMRFIFKIEKKLFLYGLGAVVVFGVVLVMMRILTQP